MLGSAAHYINALATIAFGLGGLILPELLLGEFVGIKDQTALAEYYGGIDNFFTAKDTIRFNFALGAALGFAWLVLGPSELSLATSVLYYICAIIISGGGDKIASAGGATAVHVQNLEYQVLAFQALLGLALFAVIFKSRQSCTRSKKTGNFFSWLVLSMPVIYAGLMAFIFLPDPVEGPAKSVIPTNERAKAMMDAMPSAVRDSLVRHWVCVMKQYLLVAVLAFLAPPSQGLLISCMTHSLVAFRHFKYFEHDKEQFMIDLPTNAAPTAVFAILALLALPTLSKAKEDVDSKKKNQ